MTKRPGQDELLDKVVDRTGVAPDVAASVVNAFLDEIYQSLKQGQPVTLRNFGSFYVRPARDSWVFKFTPSQKWRAMLGWSSSYGGEL
jgi:DNA-binding protein HU-beta